MRIKELYRKTFVSVKREGAEIVIILSLSQLKKFKNHERIPLSNLSA